jgi:hypothetical protein
MDYLLVSNNTILSTLSLLGQRLPQEQKHPKHPYCLQLDRPICKRQSISDESEPLSVEVIYKHVGGKNQQRGRLIHRYIKLDDARKSLNSAETLTY